MKSQSQHLLIFSVFQPTKTADMCQLECQCVICEMDRQGVVPADEDIPIEKLVDLFNEFVEAGLGS